MLKFHWMERNEELNVDSLKKISKNLEDAGYESLLLVFHSNSADNWIKAAHSINLENKIKYIIAIRPYVISPTYCAMMYESFNRIAPGRIILNIVAGHILDREPEPEACFGIEEDVTNIKGRMDYIPKFLDQFYNSKVLSSKPNILVGTSSNELTQIAGKYTDTSLCVYDAFKQNDLNAFKKKIVAIHIVIRDTDEEAEEFMSKFDNQRIKEYTFYGTKATVLNKLVMLEKEGATDVMISNINGDPNYFNIHELVNEIVSSRQTIYNGV